MSTENIHPIDVILHKRDGLVLSDAEIEGFVRAIVERTAANQLVTDAQIAAFLMAVFQRGLTLPELATLTRAMRFSGEVFDATPLHTFTVDKHSTGGVGDKTSLLIAPVVAAAGLTVPMISGRSLGHTGGTLDKLETIPGFDTQIPLARFGEILAECRGSLIGQTPSIVPADRVLYGLRDHTGTVESPYLICASIMSKKLAESLNALVLDVKTGSGAFMKRYEDAKFLAELMVATGEASGTRTVALLTSMDEPLGRFSGNWVEVWECVDILQNRRHPRSADLIELSNILSGYMLYLGGKAESPEAGAKLSDELLRNGEAYKSWLKIVAAHQGSLDHFADPAAFHAPGATQVLTAQTSGYLSALDCTQVGWAVQRLGAGRAKPGDPVSANAGLEMHVKLGEAITAGQPLVTIFADREDQLAEPARMLLDTMKITPEKPTLNPLIREVVTNGRHQ